LSIVSAQWNALILDRVVQHRRDGKMFASAVLQDIRLGVMSFLPTLDG